MSLIMNLHHSFTPTTSDNWLLLHSDNNTVRDWDYNSEIVKGFCLEDIINESFENAGYVAYAYLGGQARRDIHYGLSRNNEDEDEDEDDTPSIKKRKRF